MNIISLGAGVQSTTMALMAAHGEIKPMPDCAIFADTGDEPQAIYRHLIWLEKVLPFPVHRVVRKTDETLSQHIMAGGVAAGIPFFTREGMAPRQCSTEFKVRPIQRKIRKLLGNGRLGVGAVQLWLGISLDEAIRMKVSLLKYIVNRYPLIEKEMRRHHCLAWMERHGYPKPAKSACIYCPYRNLAEWRDVRSDAEDWHKAVAFDTAIRGLLGGAYVHRQRVPLAEVDLSTAEERGQLNLFDDECEGMCGV